MKANRGKRRTTLKEAFANVRMELRAIRQPYGLHLGTLVLSTERRMVRENRDGFRLGFMTAKMIAGTATDDELIDAGLKSPRHLHSV